MVYCNLKVKNSVSAIYNIGTSIGDLSGEIVFFKDLREPILLRQALKSPVSVRHIASIYGKYRTDFKNGVFKDRLAYEIG